MLKAYLDAGTSLMEIGALLERDASTIGYWVRKHGLTAANRAKHAPRGGVDEEALKAMVGEGLTQREIAARVGLSLSTVRHWLHRYGLKTVRRRWPAPADGAGYTQRPCRRHGMTAYVNVGGTGRYRCVKCRSEAVSARRRRVKEILVREAGGQCEICGYHRSVVALHFHHLDPSDKRHLISHGGATIAIDRLRTEASKCALLCANCHAEVEAGLATLPVREDPSQIVHDPG